jgi:exopolysaccharide production protein ExoZ
MSPPRRGTLDAARWPASIDENPSMTVPSQKAAPRLILPIQYLRGVAALMVVWFHGVEQIPGIDAFFPVHIGNAGVDLFFVISGFIMVVTTHNATMSPLEFMRRRVIRIVPLYWLLTLVMVAVALCAPSLFKTLLVLPQTLVQSLLFIPHFSHSFPDRIWPLLVPGWSLNFEMFFYLLFAASLALPGRYRLGALVGTLLVLSGVGMSFGPFASACAQVYTSPLLLLFVSGGLLGRWWLHHRRELPVAAAVLLMIGGAVLMLLPDQPVLGSFSQMIGATLTVTGALHARFAAWKNPVLKALGDSSYSLYLTHIFTLGVLRIVWTYVGPVEQTRVSATCFMLLAMLACGGAGVLAYRWVENPLLRRLSGLGAPRANAVAAELKQS